MMTPEARKYMDECWAAAKAEMIAHPPDWVKRLDARFSEDFAKCFGLATGKKDAE